MFGRIVFEKQLNNVSECNIDLRKEATGTYIIRAINKEGKSMVTKFIKN
jgi:hypothetical protein